MSQKTLQDKVVLITGTGGGIGRESALRFSAAGAKIIGCDLNVKANLETAEQVKAQGGTIDVMGPIDLGNPKQARQWIEDAAAIHGKIDIVFNNASAARFAPFESFPIEDWQFTIRNELDLVFYVARFAWPHLQKSHGVLINMGSVAGIVGSGPGGAAHAATKGAVIALTKHLAQEGSEHDIRVVAISPGFIETPGTADFSSVPEIRESLIARNIIKRIGQPADIAGVAVFLASDAAAFMTGNNIVVDGGRVSN